MTRFQDNERAASSVGRRGLLSTSSAGVALLALAVCVGLVQYTDHGWEDYYITFRASRNLADGSGLVYQVGEHVHVFTSPLGVLLPALAAWLTSTDEAALEVFRWLSMAAFAGAVVLMEAALRRWGGGRGFSVLAAVLLCLDVKAVDYSVNGMETGVLLLALASTLAVHVVGGRWRGWRLGLCWGLLMWCRPDGFVLGGAIALAWLVVLPEEPGGRRTLLHDYVKALGVAGAVYLPWVAWAWWYYGSPIPNTIVAKGLAMARHGWAALWLLPVKQTILFPWLGGLRDVLQPAYVRLGGWPPALRAYLCLVAWLAILAWMVPGLSRRTRCLSLALFLGSLYAGASPGAPWYLPAPGFWAILTIASATQDLWARSAFRAWVGGMAVMHAALCASVFVAAAVQLRWHQTLCEAQRKEVGLWLRAHARTPEETVFLESLGYIGYFSQLKMLDFPGLSAPEVISARRRLGDDWAMLIRELRPHWIVLRPFERAKIEASMAGYLEGSYDLARDFDIGDQVLAVRILPGREYLMLDSRFMVYHLRHSDGGS